MFQRSAWRALFRRRRQLVELPAPEPDKITHPAQLCRCFFGPADPSHDVLKDHDPGCLWVAAMCEGCAGTGWCVKCGGDGTRPDWEPPAAAPQLVESEPTKRERPSARRIA